MLRKRPWIISLVLVLAMSAWIASGSMENQSPAEEKTVESEQAADKKLVTVRVRQAVPELVAQSVVVYGRTAPNRSVTLKTETHGRITEILCERGAAVSMGQPLLSIAINDRQQQLDHARAQLAQRKLEYEGAKSLSTKGFQGKAQLAERKAALKESVALIAALELDIDNTVIKAPFDGVLQDRLVEVGDYVLVGDPVAQVADLDPVIVRGDVTQADVQHLESGQVAHVTLSGGSQYTGRVRYLASISDEKTNTFRVEVSLDNADNRIFGGLSAELEIPLGEVKAVKISPSLMALDEKGVIGIKWVKEGLVQFTPVNVVKSDARGTWISGLDENAQIITVGQGFVRVGDRVEITLEDNQDS